MKRFVLTLALALLVSAAGAVSVGPFIMNDSAGASLNAVSKSATFNTAWYSPGGSDVLCAYVTIASASSANFALTVEVSPDGGTTNYSLPATLNSETSAAMAAFTANGNFHECWEISYPVGSGPRYRFVVTRTGGSATFTVRASGLDRSY